MLGEKKKACNISEARVRERRTHILMAYRNIDEFGLHSFFIYFILSDKHIPFIDLSVT